MAISQYKRPIYEIGPFRLDAQERVLVRGGEAVSLIPKAFDLLVVLVESRGRLLEKDELLRCVWPDSFVEEGNLAQNISVIRKALGESETTKYIETVPRRGYRFVASVKEIRDRGAELIVVERVRSPITIEQEVEGRVNPEAAARGKTLHRAKDHVPAWSFKVLAVLGFLAVTAAGVFYWTRSNPNPAMRTIAVLPFKPLLADSRNEAHELGMAETLINKLSGIREIVVRPLDMVRKYNALDQDPLAAGRELGVDYVLTGSLQMEGKKTRANVRLLSVKDGTTVWAEICDEQCSDVFELQDAIAGRIASALKVELTGEDRKRLARHYTENTDAYNAYLLGRYFLHKRTPETTERSIEYLEEAIRLDPNYSPAYASLADAHLTIAKLKSRLPEEVMAQSKAAAEKALAIDDTQAEAHAALGSIRFYEWDWSGAEREFKRASELNPNYERNGSDYEHCLLAMKRFDEALAESKRVLELDPTSAHYNRNVGMILYFGRRYDHSIEQCNKTLELDPNYPTAYTWLARSYDQKRLYDQAIEAYLKQIQFAKLGAEGAAALREAYAASGWRGFWRKTLDLNKDQAKQTNHSLAVFFAEIYARLGEKDQAFAWLEKAYEQRLTVMKFINTDPVWDDLRSDPRYGDLVRRMGLEP
jgi:DNA-binding winged helix-turn-helix (wHTH) protein/TolB-like protein